MPPSLYKLNTELLNDLFLGVTPELLMIDCIGQDLPESELTPHLYFQILESNLKDNKNLEGIYIINASEQVSRYLAGSIASMSQALEKVTLLAFEGLTEKSLMHFKSVLTNPNFAAETLLFNNLSARAIEEVSSESALLGEKASLTTIALNNLTPDAASALEPLIIGQYISTLYIHRCTKETMKAVITTLKGKTSLEEINLSEVPEPAVKLLYDAKDVIKNVRILCDETIPNAQSWQEKFIKLNPELYQSSSESGEGKSPTIRSSKRLWQQRDDVDAEISDNPPGKKSKSEKAHPYTSPKTTYNYQTGSSLFLTPPTTPKSPGSDNVQAEKDNPPGKKSKSEKSTRDTAIKTTHNYQTRSSRFLTPPTTPKSPSGSEGERKYKEEGKQNKPSSRFSWSRT